MKNESVLVESLRKRLQRQILRYAVATFKLVTMTNQMNDEKKINQEMAIKYELQKENQMKFTDMICQNIVKIQQMSYRGQQRHELKVADARILMGRLRQKALRLLQSTKAWKENANNDTVRVLVAGGGGGGGSGGRGGESRGGDQEDEESRFAVPFQNDDGMVQDQQIMHDMFGSKRNNGNNNRRDRRDPTHKRRRGRGRGRKGKRGGRRKKNHNNFLPALGGGLSVPELDIHDAGKRKKQRPYMSSSFDMARQPFMKSSPFDASPSPQLWEGKCCCVWCCWDC